MRHRRRGRKLGRNPNHQRALLRNLASNLILTEREIDPDLDENAPKVKGRVVTTLPKAKEVRPLVEKCVRIACKSLAAEEDARQFETDAEKHSDGWRQWRQSDEWQKWNRAKAPAIAARRQVLKLLGNREAVEILFDDIAPRFAERPGGYTRVLRLATPRLGDAGTRAIIEFVGVRDRIIERSEKPAFDTEEEETDETASTQAADESEASPETEEQAEASGEEEAAEDSSEKAEGDSETNKSDAEEEKK